MKLKEFSTIQIGYQHNKKIDPISDGTYKIIQIKDIDDNHNIIPDSMFRIKPKRKRLVERYLVNKGDVLFLSRGQRKFATAIDIPMENTIAAGHFFILKFDASKILPKYLEWYINQPPAQKFLHSMAKRGTHMPIIGKSEFEQMKVNIPPLQVQAKIVKLSKLLRQEDELVEKIKEKRRQIVQSICLNAAREGK